MSACPECGSPTPCSKCAAGVRVMGLGSAVAIGRFNPDGVIGYRAKTMPDAPVRATRAEAIEDERAHLESPCLTPTECDKAAGCFVCQPCAGDSTHYFHKDEAPCQYCGRYLTDHILEKK